MLKDYQLLQDYSERFYGYGSWNSKIWFIGMEEGGKGSASESAVQKRLELWQKRGARDVENAPEFYSELSYAGEWFGLQPKLQPTWKQLIRILFYVKRKTPTKDSMLAFQAGNWGRPECEAAIFEMFALPAENSAAWPYPAFTNAWFLKSRGLHTHLFYNSRAAYFRQKIQNNHPECLIFYGTGYEFLIEGVIRHSFESTPINGLKAVIVEGVNCFLIRHPAARNGVDDAYFEKAGRYISQFLGQ